MVSLAPREGLSLETKVRIADLVTADAIDRFSNPVVMWTGGKDSTLVLSFVRAACEAHGISVPPLLVIDHGTHFEETWKLLEDVKSGLNLRAIIARNDDVIDHAESP